MKELTVKETYEQALRAISRLRKKELICGPWVEGGLCCASGAMDVHSNNPGMIEVLEEDQLWTGKSRYWYNSKTTCKIIDENEFFRPDDNSPSARKARYNHVKKFIKNQIRALA